MRRVPWESTNITLIWSPQHTLTTLVTWNICVKNSVHIFEKEGGVCHNCQMCKWFINYSMEKIASKGLHNSLTESIFWRSSPNLIINKFCWLIMLFNYDSIMALTICLINFHIIPPATGKNHVLYKKVNQSSWILNRYQISKVIHVISKCKTFRFVMISDKWWVP